MHLMKNTPSTTAKSKLALRIFAIRSAFSFVWRQRLFANSISLSIAWLGAISPSKNSLLPSIIILLNSRVAGEEWIKGWSPSCWIRDSWIWCARTWTWNISRHSMFVTESWWWAHKDDNFRYGSCTSAFFSSTGVNMCDTQHEVAGLKDKINGHLKIVDVYRWRSNCMYAWEQFNNFIGLHARSVNEMPMLILIVHTSLSFSCTEFEIKMSRLARTVIFSQHFFYLMSSFL